jgi:hypothetical protein
LIPVPESKEAYNMTDAVFVTITIAFFVLSIAYVHFCDRLK